MLISVLMFSYKNHMLSCFLRLRNGYPHCLISDGTNRIINTCESALQFNAEAVGRYDMCPTMDNTRPPS